MSTTKRQPVDYVAQVAARRAAAAGAQAPDAPTAPQGGGENVPTVTPEQPPIAQERNPEPTTDAKPAPVSTNGTPSKDETIETRPAEPQPATPPKRRIGVSADRPIEKKKVDRQGIDLRPIDRERWTRFEMFCLDRRLRLGKKRGLTQYARAGLQLLDELMSRDAAAAEALLQSVAEASPADA